MTERCIPGYEFGMLRETKNSRLVSHEGAWDFFQFEIRAETVLKNRLSEKKGFHQVIAD